MVGGSQFQSKGPWYEKTAREPNQPKQRKTYSSPGPAVTATTPMVPERRATASAANAAVACMTWMTLTNKEHAQNNKNKKKKSIHKNRHMQTKCQVQPVKHKGSPTHHSSYLKVKGTSLFRFSEKGFFVK